MYTFANIFFLAGLIWGVLACVLLILALNFARLGNFIRHKQVMIVMLGAGWSFVFIYIAGYIFGKTYSGSIPPHLVLWVAIHGIIALTALVSVTILIWARVSGPDHSWEGAKRSEAPDTLRVRAYINDHHKLIGVITAFIWLFTQVGGFINLYILR